MSRNTISKAGAVLLAVSLAVGGTTLAQAQAKAADTSVSQTDKPTTLKDKDVQKQEGEEVYTLSPFVVEDTQSDNSYRANSTLAGTRIRTDLNDVASAISVITAQFMKDTGVKSNQDLLVYTPSTEVSGLGGNYSGYGGRKTYNESAGLINPSNTNRVRGLDTADNTRDYFLTDIPWDSFNVGRIDLQRGPNSILFGVGSPAGIINASTNDAGFRRHYKYENVVDKYGSFRNALDLNQVLLKNELSLRVSLLDDRKKYQQEPAFNNQKRIYTALRFDKQLLGEGNNTSVRVKFEDGRITSNNPRVLPPGDQITPWFNSTYNKVTVNTATVGNGYLSATSPAIKLLRPGGVASLQGVSSGPDVKSFFTGGTSTPAVIMNGQAGGPGWIVQAVRPLQMPTYGQYAAANLPGGSFYQDKVLTDPTVYDFFNKLLDGPNKREWQSWRAENVDLQQTFFHDMLAFDLTYDRQQYTSGQNTMLTGGYYAINMEVNEILPDGSANPYLGRPYVAGNDAFGNYSYTTTRQSKRAIVTADLKAEDYLGKNWFSKVLGHHVLTGLVNEDERDYKAVQWAQHATTTDLIPLYGLSSSSLNSIAGTRSFDWIYYLGGSLAGAGSANGANLSPINVRLTPGASNVVRYFNNTWNAAATVNKTDPFTYKDYNTGATVVGTQVDNPANYVGWTSGPVKWLDASNPSDFQNLVIGGNRQNYRDLSKGFTWQGYLFDGDLVPTFGWRKDHVINYDTNAQSNQQTGIAPLDYELSPGSRRESIGQSRNWSGVYHIPKKLTEKVLGGLSISLLYNESSNFKADAPRRNLMGNIIPNPQGRTREKGIVISMLNDRVTLKANWFKTLNSNATLASGASAILGSQSYEMYQLMSLGYAEAAMVQDAMKGVPDGGLSALFLPTWINYAYNDAVPGVAAGDNLTNTSATSAYQTAQQTINSQKMVNSWLNIPSFITSQFYKFWNVPGTGIDPAKAKASGMLHSAFGGTDAWSDFNYLVSILSPSASTLPVSTVDTLSKGQEYELSVVPTKNWNITVNYVRTFATRTNLDQSTIAYMNGLNDFFMGDAGYLRLWALPAYQINNLWHKDLWLPYQVTLSSQGQSAPEVAPWRLNLVSSYTFDHGKAKGLMVGGAARLEASRISGYRYSSTLGYLDVQQPIMGPKDTHVDLWVGYTKKLNYHDMAWHIQLNVRNVGEKTRLVPAYYEPDGSLSLARIQEGMTWAVSNSLEF
jgi:hypothetical protein